MERGPITFAQHGLGPPAPGTAAAVEEVEAAGGAFREEAGSGGSAAMVPRRDSEGGEGFRVRAERCGAGAQRGPEAVEPEGSLAVGPTSCWADFEPTSNRADDAEICLDAHARPQPKQQGRERKQKQKGKSKQQQNGRRCRGSNPGRPRDRREYSPLYYNDARNLIV